MVVAIASTLMMGLTTDLWLWLASRYLAGLASAAAMLLGTGLILNWLMRHNHRPELGIHFSGIGLSIAGCSAAVWLMTPTLDWRTQWLAFSALACLLIIPALRWLPAPDNSGLTASGRELEDAPPSPLFLRLFMAAYFCAGVGYVVSATFIVAIVNQLPGMAGHGAMIFSPSGSVRRRRAFPGISSPVALASLNALILAAILQIVGILLPLAIGGLLPAIFAALLFGSTFVGMVSLVLTMAGRYYPTKPAKMMGKMTISYGAAQILAPAITGWLATQSGHYAGGLWLAAGVMVAGTLLLVVLKGIERRDAALGLQTCPQG